MNREEANKMNKKTRIRKTVQHTTCNFRWYR